MLAEAGSPLDRVIALEVSDAELVDRILGRRQSVATGRIYNITLDPPPADDPGPFIQRTDDTPEDVLRRLEVYHRETEPLKRHYRERGLLTEVDASGLVDGITEAILRALKRSSA